MNGSRTAAPGLTPVHEILGHEERITQLERQNGQLQQMVGQQALAIAVLVKGIEDLRQCVRIAAATDLAHNDRLSRLEHSRQGDLRLTEILGGIEQRLGAVEQGVCR